MSVSKFRFIREKSGDRFSKFLFIMLPMRLIHRLNLYLTGGFVNHINIIPMRSAISCQLRNINLPVPFRYNKFQTFLRDRRRQIDPIFRIYKSICAILTDCIDSQHPIVIELFCRTVRRIVRHHFFHHIRFKWFRII